MTYILSNGFQFLLDFNLGWDIWVFKIIIPLSIMFLVAGLIGLERQNVGKAAGLSAHILVGLAACGLAIMQRLMLDSGTDTTARIVAQVVTGVGFIGAGVILKDGQTVRGITTAATIWATAAIGLILGAGYTGLASLISGIILIFIYVRDFARGVNPFKYRQEGRATLEEKKTLRKRNYNSQRSITDDSDDYTGINL